MITSYQIRGALIEIQRLMFEQESEGVDNTEKIEKIKKEIDYYNLGLSEEEMAATSPDRFNKPKTD